MNRVNEELALLRRRFPDLEFLADGQWVRLPTYQISGDLWIPPVVEIAFQIPAEAASAPYGFHARAVTEEDGDRPALALCNRATITNVTFPTSTPWGNDWTLFSWQLEAWSPAEPITSGSNMSEFVRSIQGRFAEGA